jgi:predicted transcriptional regulator of viral defense system
MKQNVDSSQTQKLRNQIQKMERGSIFLSDAFAFVDKSVLRVVLSRFTTEGLIERLGPGIYLYPRYSELLRKNVTPSIDEIAHAIAIKEKSRIAPSGSYAMYKLGLSTQVPTIAVFLTDGSPREITLNDNRTIVFKSTTAKNLAFTNTCMQLLVSSLKKIGKHNISSDHLSRIRDILAKLHEDDFRANVKLAPEWIQKLLVQNKEEMHAAL